MPLGAAAAAALAAAAAEGLTLVRADNASGYKHVFPDPRPTKSYRPFKAQVWHPAAAGGGYTHLGMFSTAEEGALAVARYHRDTSVASSDETRTMGIEVSETELCVETVEIDLC